jgi:hypothetical protein
MVSIFAPVIGSSIVSGLFWYRKGVNRGRSDAEAHYLYIYSRLIKRAYVIGKYKGHAEATSGFRGVSQADLHDH